MHRLHGACCTDPLQRAEFPPHCLAAGAGKDPYLFLLIKHDTLQCQLRKEKGLIFVSARVLFGTTAACRSHTRERLFENQDFGINDLSSKKEILPAKSVLFSSTSVLFKGLVLRHHRDQCFWKERKHSASLMFKNMWSALKNIGIQ